MNSSLREEEGGGVNENKEEDETHDDEGHEDEEEGGEEQSSRRRLSTAEDINALKRRVTVDDIFKASNVQELTKRQQQWADAKKRARALRHKYRVARRKYAAAYHDFTEECNNFIFPVETGTLKDQYEMDMLYCESVFLRDPYGKRALRVKDKKVIHELASMRWMMARPSIPWRAKVVHEYEITFEFVDAVWDKHWSFHFRISKQWCGPALHQIAVDDRWFFCTPHQKQKFTEKQEAQLERQRRAQYEARKGELKAARRASSLALLLPPDPEEGLPYSDAEDSADGGDGDDGGEEEEEAGGFAGRLRGMVSAARDRIRGIDRGPTAKEIAELKARASRRKNQTGGVVAGAVKLTGGRDFGSSDAIPLFGKKHHNTTSEFYNRIAFLLATNMGEVVTDDSISVIPRMSGWHDQSMLAKYNYKTFKKLQATRAFCEPRHGKWIASAESDGDPPHKPQGVAVYRMPVAKKKKLVFEDTAQQFEL